VIFVLLPRLDFNKLGEKPLRNENCETAFHVQVPSQTGVCDGGDKVTKF